MKNPGRFLLRWLVFFVLIHITVVMSTTLWPGFFHSIPAPKFWLIGLLFVLVYFPLREAILFAYLVGYSITFYSGTSPKMILFPILLIYLVVRPLKSRMFWQGNTYFVMTATLGALMFETLYVLFSKIMETNSTQVMFWDRLLSVLFVLVVSPLIYNLLFPILERLTPEESIHEQG